jgi:hypothetical protein
LNLEWPGFPGPFFSAAAENASRITWTAKALPNLYSGRLKCVHGRHFSDFPAAKPGFPWVLTPFAPKKPAFG